MRHNKGLENFTSKGIPWILVWSTVKYSRKEGMALEVNVEMKNYDIKRTGYLNEESTLYNPKKPNENNL